jgi:N-acetylmuramoyl-L-alanine amidase
MRMRRVPPLVALACLVAFAGASPAARAAQVPAASFQVSVPAEAGASAHWRTPPLRPARGFELVGAAWRGTGARVELRARRAAGGWTRWARIVAGEPVWSGPAVAVQLRGAELVRRLRVHAVAVGRPAGRSRVPRVSTAAADGRPPIVPRRVWDPHDDCRPRVTPAYGRVDFAVVHHTVSLNAYAPRDVPGMLLAICRFHRDGNGWNDIGYNLLVDRFGRVWEGRSGGVEQPVIGAQAQGWNSVSTGVAALGEFGAAGLPRAALRALARTIAWKLSLAGVPARGAIGQLSIGGDLNRWRTGSQVRFQRIAAHRDGDLTDCPGAALAAQLPQLRELTAALLPTPRDLLTISPARAPQAAGGPVVLTGRLARVGGRRPAGAPIALQQRVGGAWVDVAAATTGEDGIWTAALPLAENAELRVVHPSSGIASPAIAVPVRAGIAARVSRDVVRLGGDVELTGMTSPAKARVRVLIDRRLERRRFRRVRTYTVATVNGGFARTLRLPAAGVYRIRVTTAADGANAAGASRPLALRVRSTASGNVYREPVS